MIEATQRTPLVIAIAPTGARKGKADHASIPIAPEEIVAEARACGEAGATMIHLHVRDREGGHTLDADAYRPAINALHAALGAEMVVQMTTEAVGRYTAEQQIAAVEALQPEAVSVAIREIVPDDASEERAAAFFTWLSREGVLPQIILYAPEEIAGYAELRQRGVIPDSHHSLLFVLGRYAKDQRSSPKDLLPFVTEYESRAIEVPWMVCAFGGRESDCAATAISLGGHARVGFENNHYRPDGSIAASNADAVSSVAAVANAIARPLARRPATYEILGGGLSP